MEPNLGDVEHVVQDGREQISAGEGIRDRFAAVAGRLAEDASAVASAAVLGHEGADDGELVRDAGQLLERVAEVNTGQDGLGDARDGANIAGSVRLRVVGFELRRSPLLEDKDDRLSANSARARRSAGGEQRGQGQTAQAERDKSKGSGLNGTVVRGCACKMANGCAGHCFMIRATLVDIEWYLPYLV